MTEVYVVFNSYRQVEGEYVAILVDCVFSKREDAENYINNKQRTWRETRKVPIEGGGEVDAEFQGWLSIFAAPLK
jgi:hypothetical protein